MKSCHSLDVTKTNASNTFHKPAHCGVQISLCITHCLQFKGSKNEKSLKAYLYLNKVVLAKVV